MEIDERDYAQVDEELPCTHILVYKNREYPVNFELFKYSSDYFNEHEDDFIYSNRIELADYDPDGNIPELDSNSIETFINFIERKRILITNENVGTLNYLAHKYKVKKLIASTEDYIKRHEDEVCLSILIVHQNDGQISNNFYEDMIADHLNKYVQKKEMLNLNVNTLYRILEKHRGSPNQSEIKNEVNNLVQKAIEKYGREASVLIQFIDVDSFGSGSFIMLLESHQELDIGFISRDFLKLLSKIERLKQEQAYENEKLKKENTKLQKENIKLINQYNQLKGNHDVLVKSLNQTQINKFKWGNISQNISNTNDIDDENPIQEESPNANQYERDDDDFDDNSNFHGRRPYKFSNAKKNAWVPPSENNSMHDDKKIVQFRPKTHYKGYKKP